MQDILIRDARQQDISAILALSHAGAVDPDTQSAPDATDPTYLAAFSEIDADPNEQLVVVEQHGEIVGTLHISFLRSLAHRSALYGQLENIHVRTDQRGNGLGSRMVDWAINRCRDRGCRRVQLTSNKARTGAHRFYERLGFAKSHEGFKLYL